MPHKNKDFFKSLNDHINHMLYSKETVLKEDKPQEKTQNNKTEERTKEKENKVKNKTKDIKTVRRYKNRIYACSMFAANFGTSPFDYLTITTATSAYSEQEALGFAYEQFREVQIEKNQSYTLISIQVAPFPDEALKDHIKEMNEYNELDIYIKNIKEGNSNVSS